MIPLEFSSLWSPQSSIPLKTDEIGMQLPFLQENWFTRHGVAIIQENMPMKIYLSILPSMIMIFACVKVNPANETRSH